MPGINLTFRTAFIATAITLTACTSFQFGRDFDLTHFKSEIQHGVTTQQQVQTWLGPPTSTGTVVDTDGEHYERWMYYYGAGQLTRMKEANMKTLEIQFSADNVVKSYNWVGE